MSRFVLLAVLALSGCGSRGNFPVYKPGVSKEQADLDIKDCEARAHSFIRNRAAHIRDQAQAYNRLVLDCMRDRGYSMSGE
jgi:predicted small lipoprotein YifL